MGGVKCAGLDEVSESGKSKTTEGFEDDHVKKCILDREPVSALHYERGVHRVWGILLPE